jgi:hypothetical protein
VRERERKREREREIGRERERDREREREIGLKHIAKETSKSKSTRKIYLPAGSCQTTFILHNLLNRANIDYY